VLGVRFLEKETISAEYDNIQKDSYDKKLKDIFKLWQI